jgi:hypothetical protein
VHGSDANPSSAPAAVTIPASSIAPLLPASTERALAALAVSNGVDCDAPAPAAPPVAATVADSPRDASAIDTVVPCWPWRWPPPLPRSSKRQ